ncbi:hypothetical protein [Vannielia litorea]|uniref:Uncharacterized protein n=1 Tax=Vannielia litorea TaxID=1217970 RepID=A0A1N6GY52_9RHOB|nr:hypothetical protein [Vannielia litorea]SIO12382.1 hypothetical protein SAMN05444002_2892 [Vannielia litorea]
MLRISALVTAIALGISAQAALAGSASFDLPRVDFGKPVTTLSTSGPLVLAPVETGK